MVSTNASFRRFTFSPFHAHTISSYHTHQIFFHKTSTSFRPQLLQYILLSRIHSINSLYQQYTSLAMSSTTTIEVQTAALVQQAVVTSLTQIFQPLLAQQQAVVENEGIIIGLRGQLHGMLHK